MTSDFCGRYSVDSIKRTVHLTFHGLFFLLKILFFFEKLKTVFLIETVWKNKDAKIQAKKDLKGDPKGIQRGAKGIHTYVYKYLPMYL